MWLTRSIPAQRTDSRTGGRHAYPPSPRSAIPKPAPFPAAPRSGQEPGRPVRGRQLWVTSEVVRGGFATGSPRAAFADEHT
jgi:hypothetical protein